MCRWSLCIWGDVYITERVQIVQYVLCRARACRKVISQRAGAPETVSLHTREQTRAHLAFVPGQLHAHVFMCVPVM